MLWLCFSEKGCSKPYFLNKGISMNQYNYLKEFIQKRVMPFIRQYHADINYIFWPDQARAHHAKSVINYLKNNWQAKNVKLPKDIVLSKLDMNLVQQLFL